MLRLTAIVVYWGPFGEKGMSGANPTVVFILDRVRLGLELSAVERVVHLVEINPLPGAPEVVIGIINVHSQIIPVIDIRKRLGLRARAPRLSDQLILAHTSRRGIALLADRVEGLVDSSTPFVTAGRILPNLEPVAGVLAIDDGLVLIQDLDAFLSLEQERQLTRAMEQQRST